MKKLNSKGFTLVELLVAITILGIVLVIALPQVSNLQTENAKTKYKKYAESVVSSAKLYTDSYSKDMFGNNSSGCYDIPYSALSAKSLVKDIKIDNSTCDTYAADKKTSLTFVRVYKSNENYLYDISIKCNDKNGKEIYNESLEKDICDGTRTDTEGPTISISVNSNWTTGKDASGNALNATVKIRDPYGLKENVQVEYAWTKTPSNISGLTFKTKKFTNSRTELVQELSFKVQYPQNENGEWYLVVRPAGTEGLRDANGNYYSGGYEKSAVVRLDNTKPTIDKTTNSHNGKWTADQVTISATASDTLSGVKKIYYTYKSDGSSLKSDWAKSFTAGSRGPVEVSKIWTQELNETIYVVAEDMVGNKSIIKSAGEIKIAKEFTVTFNPNGGSVSPTSKIVTYGQQYGSMPTPMRASYKFDGWYTTASGGTKITSDSIVKITGNITLYAHWTKIKHKVTYNYTYNGGTSTTATSIMVDEGSAINLSPKASKSGWSFVGWNTNHNAHTKLSNLKMGTSDITLYAIYSKQLDITLIDHNDSKSRTRHLYPIMYNNDKSASQALPAPGDTSCSCGSFEKIGWTTSKSANANVLYASTGTYSFSSNITLYALYNLKQEFIIDFNAGTTASRNAVQIRYRNGSGAEANTGPYTYTFNDNCRRSGWNFYGWIKTVGPLGNNKQYKKGDSVTWKCTTMYSAEWVH